MAIFFGYDASGNGNNWTANGLSNAPGVGNDSMVDTPTNYGTDTGVGGEVRGNYATINPLQYSSTYVTLNNGNLNVTGSSVVDAGGAFGTAKVNSGKWYWEATIVAAGSTYPFIGFGVNTTGTQFQGGARIGPSGTPAIVSPESFIALNGSPSGTSFTTNAILQFALDMDNGKMWIGKNGTWMNSGVPASGTGNMFSISDRTQFVSPYIFSYNSSQVAFNFGQRAFDYTAPSGFKALCTQNIPPVTIGATSTTQANKYMDVTLYTGNQTVRSITNSGSMQPDFVWDKLRSGANSHRLFDAVRGVEKALYSNLSNGEATETGTLTAFNSNGFSLGTNTETNTTGSTYVAWQWNAGGSTVTNTTGTISAQVRANPTAGFSVLTYTGNGTNNETIGHGLSATPSMIIVKARNTSYNWDIYHASLGIGATLTFTNSSTRNVNAFGTSNPTPSVFYTYNNYTNTSTYTYVAYVFAPVAGYSAFGSYTGNNSTDGPFIYLGFRPKFWMVKRTDSTGDWYIYDSARSPYNAGIETLAPSQTFGESSFGSLNYFDLLSNGLKIRQNSTNGFANVLNAIYIYAAFAEHPFKYSLAR